MGGKGQEKEEKIEFWRQYTTAQNKLETEEVQVDESYGPIGQFNLFKHDIMQHWTWDRQLKNWEVFRF
jgi:hypothetical protein